MHHVTTRALVLAALLAPLAACGGSDDPVDLGHDDAHALGAALSDYAGSWQGRTEAFTFEDGSDAVRIDIGANGQGELLLGDSPELPPPDPNHEFPPDPLEGVVGRQPPVDAVVGFRYPLTSRVSEDRLQLFGYSGEIYREWCEEMTPHFVAAMPAGTLPAMPAHYACLSAPPSRDDATNQCFLADDPGPAIDCGIGGCLLVCQCSEGGCSVSDSYLPSSAAQLGSGGENIQIDARLEDGGDSFVGTLVLGSERIPVLMARM